MQTRKIIGRSIRPERVIEGSYDGNHMLNSLLYDVESPDGKVKEHSANIIAENMISIIDSDVFLVTLLEDITECKKDESESTCLMIM